MLLLAKQCNKVLRNAIDRYTVTTKKGKTNTGHLRERHSCLVAFSDETLLWLQVSQKSNIQKQLANPVWKCADCILVKFISCIRIIFEAYENHGNSFTISRYTVFNSFFFTTWNGLVQSAVYKCSFNAGDISKWGFPFFPTITFNNWYLKTIVLYNSIVLFLSTAYDLVMTYWTHCL